MTLTVRIRGERQTVVADNPYDLVGKMNRASFAAQPDQRQWMKQAAERAHSITGRTVRYDTAAHFIHDLFEVGMLSDVDRGGE